MNNSGIFLARTIGIIIFFIIIFYFLTANLYAQKTDLQIPNRIEVVEGGYNYENQSRNGFKIMIDGDTKEVLKFIKKDLKETFEIKAKSKKDGIIAEEQLATNISDKHFDLYATYFEKDKELIVWLSFGMDIYVNSSQYSKESNTIKDYLIAFSKRYYSQSINDNIEIQEKEVNTLAKRLEQDKKELNNLEKQEINLKEKQAKEMAKKSKTEAKIAKLKSDLAEGEQKIENYEAEIAKYKTQIEEEEIKVKEKSEGFEIENQKLTELKKQLEKINAL